MPLSAQDIDFICNEVLSQIEIREARLLNWGFIQGMQKLDWLSDMLPSIVKRLSSRLPSLELDDTVTPKDVISNLEDRKLIFNNNKGLYRTRFSETVRLMYLLRQRFSNEDWNSGPRLVSDMKILLRRRRFPIWHISVEMLLQEIPDLSQLQKNAICLLVQNDRLARFQADAVKQQLTSLSQNRDSAIVVGAGTGSGKTRAFYIPALTHIVQNKLVKAHVQAIALYPRVELLKDQLREIYQEARKLDSLLTEAALSPIRIGVYYNGVLRSVEDTNYKSRMYERGWHRTREDEGWICPYMLCPSCGRGGLVWSDTRIEQEKANTSRHIYGKHEVLECVSCKETIQGEVMPLTRKHLLAYPPDILFTTTETLNRRLGDASEHHLFGVGVQYPPRLLLMDEIHLNEGFHGAQVAYLLRRWRYARGKRTGLCIVGLSATLSQADTFFSRLTGIDNVSYISPSEKDLTEESLEYNVILKGDPVGSTTLLSTAVRVVMLLGRTLDPMNVEPLSRGAWGQRIFAFSDKLDSINRWYHILKEVENPREPYAHWYLLDRNKISREDWQSRNTMCQNWLMATQIEKNALSTGLLLDLTSSQYRGVDPKANVVVASSTLEVGYNDPKVGAVIQHKSPYGRASFLQRKGRAGRPRTMRPWMVVVASSYGRDRWAFQHAETLFDPVLSPIDLPLENYYVRKIQAIFALIDWLALKLNLLGHSDNLWTLLSSETRYQQNPQHQAARMDLYNFLLRVLYEVPLQREIYDYIAAAMEIHEEHILKLLFWGKPRAIMLDVIPTILRQLQTNWQTLQFKNDEWTIETWTDNVSGLPLPEFLPTSLFSDLNLPEVRIQIPKRPSYKDEPKEMQSSETIGLSLAMTEFTPGKVNKRFADKDRTSEAHWIPIPKQATQYVMDIADLSMSFAKDAYTIPYERDTITVYRPQTFNLQLVPSHIRPTSNAFHRWSSFFMARDRRYEIIDAVHAAEFGRQMILDRGSVWRKVFQDIRVYTHTSSLWAEVTRYVDQTEVYMRFKEGGEWRRNLSYEAEGQRAALGFKIEVDALYVTVAPLDVDGLLNNHRWTSLYQEIKPRFLRYILGRDLPFLTFFEIDRLWQLEMAMLVACASSKNVSLEQAAEIVHSDLVATAYRTLHLMIDHVIEDDDNAEAVKESGQLIDNIIRSLSIPGVPEILYRSARLLWEPNVEDLTLYLQELYLHSVGALVFSAIVEMMPDVEPDDLHLDVKADGFWISELTAGGVGLISRIADAIELNPHRFESFLRHSMIFCEREYLAHNLDQIANLVTTDKLSACFRSIREAADLPQIEHLQQTLVTTLKDAGITINRNLLVSINTRFLRPNSAKDTDALIQSLILFWHEQEKLLGCVIDLSVIVTVAAQNPAIRDQAQAILNRVSGTDEVYEDIRISNMLQSLLWVTCHDSCPDCIEKEHRYQDTLKASRSFLRTLMGFEYQAIVVGHKGWQKETESILVQEQRVLIECTNEQLTEVHGELLAWIAQPIEIGFIFTYANLSRIEQQGDKYYFELSLSELTEAL